MAVQYLITFLEGVISFISPCMLPMLPVYVAYFAGDAGKSQGVFARALSFVLGFTCVFTLLGVGAGLVGSVLVQHQAVLNAVCGALVVVFGLSYLDIIKLPFLKGMEPGQNVTGVISAFLFGVVYSISLTPCVGAFLGSALMLAATQAGAAQGAALLVVYSLGLGVPFVISALLIDYLHDAFAWVKAHYAIINRVCGVFLIVVGIAMMFGALNYVLALFA